MAQRARRWRLGDASGSGFSVSGETVSLLAVVHIVAKRLAQDVEVDFTSVTTSGKSSLSLSMFCPTMSVDMPFIFSISNSGFNLFFQKALHFFLLGHCQKVF